MIQYRHQTARSAVPGIISVPFWLSFFTSTLAHILLTATLTTNIETDQKVETDNFMVEVVDEQFVRTASVATAVPRPPTLKNSQLSIREPTSLVEIQRSPPWELQLSNGLISGAIATKPPSKLTKPRVTVSPALPSRPRKQNTVRRSIERSFETARLEAEKIILQVKTHLPPTLSTAISIVPSMFSHTHHETSPPSSVQPKLPSPNNAVSIVVQPSFRVPEQLDENTLQTPKSETGANPQTRILPSQRPTPSQHLRPMPLPSRASVPEGAQSIIPPVFAQANSQPTVSPEFDSTEPSTEQTALLTHVRASKKHESTVDYKNPALGNRPPEYPRRARREGLEGRVVIGVSVSTQGRPREVFVRESSGMKIFDDAALAAIKHWRFIPATRGDNPVDTSVLIPIVFRLHD